MISPPRILAVRVRRDLVHVETKHTHQSAVVVKDPVSLTYHRLRPDEHFVLCLLNGRRTLEEIRDAYNDRFSPQRVDVVDLSSLVHRFHSLGLTISDATNQGEQLGLRREKKQRQRWMQHLSGVLFIRFPGIDPSPILNRIYPLARPFLGRAGMTAYAILVAIAVGIFATQHARFVGQLPSLDQWLTLDTALMLAAVIGIGKVCHELGHALVCHHFGGECHQIGPMLLVFTPALYCDTSDSWMLPSRWQRAAVGVAGIAVEVGLAAIATLVWTATGPGIVHSIAMYVMLVSSVSTLVFNANPLLRYDGYYILSDLCDTPNLGERSRRLLSGQTAKWMFGVDSDDTESVAGWGRFWMLVYAVAAFAYRWTLTLMILWIVTRIARPYGLESIGWTLAIFAALMMLVSLAKPVFSFFSHPGKRRKIKMRRSLISAMVAACTIAMLFVPLPSGLSMVARMVPRAESPVYVASPGVLQKIRYRPGQIVQKGDVLAVLGNDEVELAAAVAKGRFETQRLKVDAMTAQSINQPKSAAALPSEQALLRELRSQMLRRQAYVDALQMTAPASGRLIAGPLAPAPKPDPTGLRLTRFSGDPTEPNNRGCWLDAGTELMSVQTDERFDAEAILSQAQINRFGVGSSVRLFASLRPEQVVEATVTAIELSQFDPMVDGVRRDDVAASQTSAPPQGSYLVRMRIDGSPDQNSWIVGAEVGGRIACEPQTIAQRIMRVAAQLFRFR